MPTYEDRLQDLCAAYRSIFGQEAELDPAAALSPAVPDYQLLDLLLPQYGITRAAEGTWCRYPRGFEAMKNLHAGSSYSL